MEIKDMNNEELLRYYACHLKQIDNDYKLKKDLIKFFLKEQVSH